MWGGGGRGCVCYSDVHVRVRSVGVGGRGCSWGGRGCVCYSDGVRDEVDPSGRTEGGTGPGRTCRKPKDLSVRESEERGCEEGVIDRCVYWHSNI